MINFIHKKSAQKVLSITFRFIVFIVGCSGSEYFHIELHSFNF